MSQELAAAAREAARIWREYPNLRLAVAQRHKALRDVMERLVELSADARQPAAEPHRTNTADELTDQQRRDFFGDHPLWSPFRELYARIADAGCACTDDESCRDHDLLDRKIGAEMEKQVAAAGDLMRVAEDALDRLIGREHVRIKKLGNAVQAYRDARSTS